MKLLFKLILLILLYIITHISEAWSQPVQSTPASVSGRITDKVGQGLDFAAVTVIHASDSTTWRTALSDSTGSYTFIDIPPGRYLIKVVRLGYRSGTSTMFQVAEGQVFILPKIILDSSTNELKQVDVVAKKPLFEKKSDRIIVNVSASALAAGGSVSDILTIAPGVSVDNDQITLKGRQGVTIMVDNKIVKLSATQLSNLLQSMPSSSIDKIELISNPPASYDAEGKGGIINIKTKKGTNLGLNGTITATAAFGKHLRPGGAILLNYKLKKLNVFGSYTYQHNKYTSKYLSDKIITSGMLPLSYHQDQSSHGLSNGHMTSLGADYDINEKNTVGFLVTRNSKFTNSDFIQNIIFGKQGFNADSNIVSTNKGRSRFTNSGFGINSKHTLSPGGQVLLLDATYTNYRSYSSAAFTNEYIKAGGLASHIPEHITNDADEKIDLLVAKADYTLPLGDNRKLEAGLKTAFTHSNSAILFRSDPTGPLVIDNARSNAFDYKEVIGAGYLNYNTKFGKNTDVQAGLRAEYTRYSGSSPTTEQAVGRSYLQLFPNFSIQRAIGENSIGFSYSRRIDRPDYQDLNPFIDYVSPYFYTQGNPLLRPETTHSLELNYTYHQALNFDLSYSRTSDYYNYFTSLDGSGGATKQTVDNFENYDSWNLSVSYNKDILSWWSLTANGDFSYDHYRTPLLGQLVDIKRIAYTANLLNSFQINKSLALDIVGLYQSKRALLARTIAPRYRVDAALKYTFASKRATLKTGVTDIFYTYINKGVNVSPGLYGTYYNENENRRFNLSLSYRFGGSTTVSKKSRGNQEELDRIK